MSAPLKNPEPRTLLSLDELLSLDGTGSFWVVYRNKDYRVTYETLLKSIDKAALGLDKVDNTSDAEKPVSLPQQQALDLKMNKADALGIEALDNYKQEVDQRFTSLSEAIDIALQGYIATGTFNNYATAVNQALDTIDQKLLALETASDNYATKEALNQLSVALSDAINRLVSNRIVPMEQELASLKLSMTAHLDEYAAFLQEYNTWKQEITQRVELLEQNPGGGGNVNLVEGAW